MKTHNPAVQLIGHKRALADLFIKGMKQKEWKTK